MEKIIDISDLLGLPFEIAQSFNPKNIIAKGYPVWNLKGDTGAFFALFFDNLATQLSLTGIAIGVVGFDPGFVWEHFVGGIGLSIFFGNLYYSFQASKVATKTGNKKTCAQPYGINTPGAIAKSFGVLLPAYLSELSANGGDKMAAAQAAWSIACCANFLGGLFEVLGSLIAPAIARNVPQGAFLAPIAGVGATWLGINAFVGILSSHFAHNPIVGFVPFIIVWLAVFGGAEKMFGNYVPAVGVAGLVGIILNLLAQTEDFGKYEQVVDDSTKFLKANGLAVPDLSYMETAWKEYGSLVLSLACTNFIGTFACNISARREGDVYSPMESMVIDGLGSMLGALFGSPYGTTVYIGHVAYKKMGATRGYSMLNGVLWLIFGMFGVHALLDAIVPHEIVAGVLIIIGFAMAAQTIESVPARWYPAVLFGISLCFSDLMLGSGLNSTDYKLLGNGYVFLSCLYTFFLMMLTDRWFLAAAGVLLVMFVLTFIGLIHADKMNWKYNKHGTLKGKENEDMFGPDSGMPGWKFLLMYGASMVLMVACHFLQRMRFIEPAEEEDFREKQRQEFKCDAADQGDEVNL